jgi:FAD/FMN-containing dehydrogenase
MSDPSLTAIRATVDAQGWVDDPQLMAPYLQEWRDRFQGAALAVLRPSTTEQVAAIVRQAGKDGIQIVPQGGNTGLAGGSMPYPGERAILLSLQRMNRIREIDALDYTVVAEAGCVLETVQQAVEAEDRLLPISLGAKGSCTIGGMISTNAGGVMTLRYGNMRDRVLGIEAVLPDGQVWNGLSRLRKNNTGYDLRQLFVGAEGTLGVVTAAVLSLVPRPRQTETAFVAVRDPAAAIALLARLRDASGDSLVGFELIPLILLDSAIRNVAGTVDPLMGRYEWYVLIEATSGTPDGTLRAALERALADAIEAGLVLDAAMAESVAQRNQFWFIREAIVEAQRFEGGSIKHDISVPVSRVAEFIERASETALALVPGIRPVAFGHVGDGNIHFNLTQPAGADTVVYLSRWEELNRLVHDVALNLGGSISAEHGIGRFKREELARVKNPLELDMMRRIKTAIDPEGMMNPGALFFQKDGPKSS